MHMQGGGLAKWLQYHVGLAQQIITVYNESWGVHRCRLDNSLLKTIGETGQKSKWLHYHIRESWVNWLQYYIGVDPWKWLRNTWVAPHGIIHNYISKGVPNKGLAELALRQHSPWQWGAKPLHGSDMVRFLVVEDSINDEDLFFFPICRYLVCDMAFHFVSLPLIFYPMHFLWKVKVSFYKNHPWKFVLPNSTAAHYPKQFL